MIVQGLPATLLLLLAVVIAIVWNDLLPLHYVIIGLIIGEISGLYVATIDYNWNEGGNQ